MKEQVIKILKSINNNENDTAIDQEIKQAIVDAIKQEANNAKREAKKYSNIELFKG